MVQSRMKETFGVQEEAVDKLVDDVASQSLELLSSFEISPGALRPFSTILQEANEELGKLNTSYELMVIELRQAKEKAEMLANELHLANLKLHELAFRDALTGLYNHRFFQEALDRELEKAVLCQRDLSLMILDIDHFKKVNDTYGHPVGDKVLAAISRAAERNVQSADIVARYGGEEFAVILPEADFMGAAAIAEQVRSGIERLEIDAEGIIIKTTVSIGYTSFRSSARKPDKKAIIGMADKALYIAKQSGRNRVHAMRMAGM
jgi:diguanylate cyclase (GGDEF)-like protein